MSEVEKAAHEAALKDTTGFGDEHILFIRGFRAGAAWQREIDLKVCEDTADYYDEKLDLAAGRGALQCAQTIRANAPDDSAEGEK